MHNQCSEVCSKWIYGQHLGFKLGGGLNKIGCTQSISKQWKHFKKFCSGQFVARYSFYMFTYCDLAEIMILNCYTGWHEFCGNLGVSGYHKYCKVNMFHKIYTKAIYDWKWSVNVCLFCNIYIFSQNKPLRFARIYCFSVYFCELYLPCNNIIDIAISWHLRCP